MKSKNSPKLMLTLLMCVLPLPLFALEKTDGLVKPIRETILGAPVAGIVARHRYREGELVPEGEVIVDLRKRLQEIEVARRKTLLDVALKDLQTTQKLFKSTTSVSKEEVDEKQALYDVAEAEHDLAVEQLRLREITAPFAGQINNLFDLEVGESIQIQDSIVHLVDSSRCQFVGHVDEKLSQGLNPGTDVTVEIQTTAGKIVVNAKVSFISPIVDSASGLLRVRADFDNPQGKIRPGVTATMSWGPGP